MKSINETELRKLLENETMQEDALKQYFDVDGSQPFSLKYKLKSDVHVEPEQGKDKFLGIGTVIVLIANKIARLRRNKLYEENKLKFPRHIRMVSEGDSWFQHPLVDDIIDHLVNHFNIYCVAEAGDKLSKMFQRNEYSEAIEKETPAFLLLSGGGNDIFGEEFSSFLNDYTKGHDVRRLINKRFDDKLSDIDNLYNAFVSEMAKEYPKIKIIVHGYDYIIPKDDGKWIGKYMEDKNIKSRPDKDGIIKIVVDRFNDRLHDLSAKYGSNLMYVDLRGSVHPNQWYDEIHPDSNGFQNTALRIMNKVLSLP